MISQYTTMVLPAFSASPATKRRRLPLQPNAWCKTIYFYGAGRHFFRLSITTILISPSCFLTDYFYLLLAKVILPRNSQKYWSTFISIPIYHYFLPISAYLLRRAYDILCAAATTSSSSFGHAARRRHRSQEALPPHYRLRLQAISRRASFLLT